MAESIFLNTPHSHLFQFFRIPGNEHHSSAGRYCHASACFGHTTTHCRNIKHSALSPHKPIVFIDLKLQPIRERFHYTLDTPCSYTDQSLDAQCRPSVKSLRVESAKHVGRALLHVNDCRIEIISPVFAN